MTWSSQRGAVALTTVLVISVLAVLIAGALLSGSIDAARLTLTQQQSAQARSLADACADEALEQIRASSNFTGNGNLTLGTGSCTYTVIDQGGENRLITASGSVASVIRRVTVTVTQLFPTIVTSQWIEVADF